MTVTRSYAGEPLAVHALANDQHLALVHVDAGDRVQQRLQLARPETADVRANVALERLLRYVLRYDARTERLDVLVAFVFTPRDGLLRGQLLFDVCVHVDARVLQLYRKF